MRWYCEKVSADGTARKTYAGQGLSEEQLRYEREIATPVKTLYWDYYEYVVEHAVECKTSAVLLYDSEDNLCEFEVVSAFSKRAHAEMTVFEEGEHYFHTEEQLAFSAGGCGRIFPADEIRSGGIAIQEKKKSRRACRQLFQCFY